MLGSDAVISFKMILFNGELFSPQPISFSYLIDPNKSRSQKKDGRVIMKYGRIVHNEEIHGEDPTDLAELGNT